MQYFIQMILIAFVGLTSQQAVTCPDLQVKFDNQCFLKSCFDVYNARFGTVIDPTGVGKIPITFVSTFSTNAAGLTFSISFVDVGTERNFKFDNNNSCLVYKLNRYNQQFTTLIADETANYKILNSTFNPQNGYTTWTFSIPQTDYSTKLIKAVSTTSGVTTFIGAFALDYYISSIRQASYQFTFTLQISTQSNTSLVLGAQALTQNDFASCSNPNNCTTAISTEMWVCKESTCANPLKSLSMALNNNYWILIKIITQGYQTWKLINPAITITAYTSTVFPVQNPPAADINNTVPGQIVIQMKQQFVFSAFNVSVVTDSSPPATRLMQETNNTNTTQSYQSTSATKSNLQIGCVLEKENDTVCPDCLKQYCLNEGKFVDISNCNSFDYSKGYEALCPKTATNTTNTTTTTNTTNTAGSNIIGLLLTSLILL